jgi:hypothetical protein
LLQFETDIFIIFSCPTFEPGIHKKRTNIESCAQNLCQTGYQSKHCAGGIVHQIRNSEKKRIPAWNGGDGKYTFKEVGRIKLQ